MSIKTEEHNIRRKRVFVMFTINGTDPQHNRVPNGHADDGHDRHVEFLLPLTSDRQSFFSKLRVNTESAKTILLYSAGDRHLTSCTNKLHYTVYHCMQW